MSLLLSRRLYHTPEPLVYPIELSFPLCFVDFAKPKVADPDANGTGFKLRPGDVNHIMSSLGDVCNSKHCRKDSSVSSLTHS